jgi:hypothetical protein
MIPLPVMVLDTFRDRPTHLRPLRDGTSPIARAPVKLNARIESAVSFFSAGRR